VAKILRQEKNNKLSSVEQHGTSLAAMIHQRRQVTIALPASLQDGVAAMKAIVVALLAVLVLAGIAAPTSALDANALDGRTSVEQDRIVY
jgi:hypothetical protein